MTALIIVDMLKDFVNREGKLYVPGAEQIVENICKLKKQFISDGNLVVFANDEHTVNDPEFNQFPPHCLEGTEGVEIIDPLTPTGCVNELTLSKNTFDAFSNPELEDLLDANDVNEVVIVGVATDYCIFDTAMSSKARDIYTTIITDAVAGVGRIPDIPDTYGRLETCLMTMGREEIDWAETKEYVND